MSIDNQAGPLRLLHVVGDSRFGGAAAIILGLCGVARAEGWQVDVLTTDPTFQQAVTRHGFGVVDLDVIRREIRPFRDLRGLLGLVRFLREQPYGVVHTHTSKGGFIGRLAARLVGVPVIIHTAHGFAFHEDSPVAIRLFYSGLERLASRCCHRIVSVSEFHRDWAVRLGMCGPDTIVAIPNGIAAPHHSPNIDTAGIRRHLGAGPTDVLVVTVTRLAADKGLEYLLHAAARLPRTQPHIHIAIAGDGPARNRLERMAGRLGVTCRVTFLGFRDNIADLLAAADMVVLPSVREGLSISLLEAMAAGKPIVATSIGSQREVASHGEMAWLVPPADSRSLQDAIVHLAQDCALRNTLGANARAIYESHYTEKRMLQSYKQLYLDLIGAPATVEPTYKELATLSYRPKGGV